MAAFEPVRLPSACTRTTWAVTKMLSWFQTGASQPFSSVSSPAGRRFRQRRSGIHLADLEQTPGVELFERHTPRVDLGVALGAAGLVAVFLQPFAQRQRFRFFFQLRHIRRRVVRRFGGGPGADQDDEPCRSTVGSTADPVARRDRASDCRGDCQSARGKPAAGNRHLII